MRIWLFKLNEPSMWDATHFGTRRFRASFLSEALAAAGHEVVWWTNDFQHYRKEGGHRFGADHSEMVRPGLTLRWIHGPAYRRNISIRRFRSHSVAAAKVEAEAVDWPRPDLIFSCFPTDTMAHLAVRLAQRWSIPVILDIRDQWPDVFFRGQVPRALHPLVWVLTRRIERRTKQALAGATALVGNTPRFVEWGLRKCGRVKSGLDNGNFPLGYERTEVSDADCQAAQAFWKGQGVNPTDRRFRVAFLGAFSNMYDLPTVVDAAKECPDIQFVLCGEGELLEPLRARAADSPNVVMPGRVSFPQIHVLLRCSAVGLSPYIDSLNFRENLTNKVAEYLAFSLPILSSIPGVLADLLDEYDCGGVYSSKQDLAKMLCVYREDAERFGELRANAAVLFDAVFDANRIYRRLTKHIERVYNVFHES